MSAEKLEPGWYWVKLEYGLFWEAACLLSNGMWRMVAVLYPRKGRPAIIGPRIEPPGGE